MAKILVHGHDQDASMTLKFSLSDAENLLEWEHSKEFEFNGEMYDVIVVEFFSDSVAYQCYHDKKETVLKRDFASFVSDFLHKRQPPDKQSQHTIDFFKTLYFINDKTSAIGVTDSKCKDQMSHYLMMNSDFVFSPPAPPPRSIC